MKKKILLVSILLIGIALIVIGVNKLVFAEGNEVNPNTIVLESKEQAQTYGSIQQPIKSGTTDDYEPLTENEKVQFAKWLKKGDVDCNDKFNIYDAQYALQLYTDTLVAKLKRQTKKEIYTGDLNGDNAVDAGDAQKILKYYIYKQAYPNRTITIEEFNN